MGWRGANEEGEGLDCVEERAYAKINLGLKVLRKRGDGYHDILSVLQTVDLHDVLIFRNTSGGTSIRCSDPRVPVGGGNLVYQAILAMREEMGVDRGVAVEIQKRIPLGAGLGGGSSDAAATLRALNRLWRGELGSERILGIAAGLGSDVPFLLSQGTAIASGRGEVLRHIEWIGEVFYVLVYPNFQISTRWAYERLKNLTDDTKYVKFINSIGRQPLVAGSLFDNLENDFEGMVEETYPVITEIKGELLRTGARVCSLSGSGSAVYGVFDRIEEAESAVRQLKGKARTVFLCRPILKIGDW